VLDSLDLRINLNIYYNLIRNRLLKNKILNESFKGLILALKSVKFKFIYAISDELAENKIVKGRVIK
jgi:hypothetical protein